LDHFLWAADTKHVYFSFSQEQVRKLEHEVQTLRREMIRLNADLEDRDMKLEDERLARQRAEEKARYFRLSSPHPVMCVYHSVFPFLFSCPHVLVP
jgi:hypothetical protein